MNDEFELTQLSLGQEKDKLEREEIEEKGDNQASLTCFKIHTLINFLKNEPKSADLKWSLFCAACNSYRYDSVLKPFPPLFKNEEDEKQIDRLRDVIGSCPSFNVLLKKLQNNEVPQSLFNLLYWVLITLNEPSFKYIPKGEHREIFSEFSSVMPVALPDVIFSVTYGQRHQEKFAATAMNRQTKLAFHGSRLDNFYSILNYGLQVSYNKVTAFGPGIYLSSEMGISLSYSPRGYTWAYSLFGSHISIVALCEIIDHPEVRYENSMRKVRTNIFDFSNSQSVPGKYFIVENNDLVRVRYLLIYSSDESGSSSFLESPTLLCWIKRHKMFTFIIAYIILLLGIGSSNSSFFYKFFRRLIRRIDKLSDAV